MSNDNMLPGSSPGFLGRVGTRRVNRNPIFILIAIVIVFLLVMVYVATQKANDSSNSTNESQRISSTNSSSFATQLTSKHSTGGIIPTKNETEKLTVDNNASNKIEELKNINLPSKDPDLKDPDFPPLPDLPPLPEPDMVSTNITPERERIDMAKLQLFEQSLRSKTAIDNIIAPVGIGSSNYSSSSAVQSREQMLAKISSVRQRINSSGSGSGDLSEAYKKRLEMISGAGFAEDTGVELLEETQNQGGWQLENKVQAPSHSQYILRTGFVIPGTLISGINSELPGQIVAQVSQNVYDTATGRYLLIPQGSKLNGTYSSNVLFGQDRVMVAWQRIIYPDGKALDIGSMPGTDSAGYGGLHDTVNNHYLRIFGSAVLLSGVTAGISYSQNRHRDDDKSASSALSEALGQQLGQTTMQLLNKNMNISPTIEIRPGYRFNIVVTKDMIFSKPYKPFDF